MKQDLSGSQARNGAENQDYHSVSGVLKAVNIFLRLLALALILMAFFPDLNPARISGLINRNVSLFTSGTSYSSLTADSGRALLRGWVSEGAFRLVFFGSAAIVTGLISLVASACMSLGNLRYKRLGNLFLIGGGLLQLGGLMMILAAYRQFLGFPEQDRVSPMFPDAFFVFALLALLTLILGLILQLVLLPRAPAGMKFEMRTKYRLFLMFLPFAALSFVFAYLPLLGWRYAFFDYKPGGTLSAANYTGFKWFTYLFSQGATRADILRVMRNTLAMSGLGILTSWVPMALAIMLAEFRSRRFSRTIQTLITIPNFISWVLVYAVALAMFSTDGFVNGFLSVLGVTSSRNYLMGSESIWLKMLAWGMWKGVGWSAIIYVASISSIDPQLFEAATVDGAGRFQKIRYITVPSLLPTYSVLLLLSVASILSNGMEQYYVFRNAQNAASIEVLDLYVYTLGIENGIIPLSTVVGMMKTLISLVLLFVANNVSRLVRGERIV